MAIIDATEVLKSGQLFPPSTEINRLRKSLIYKSLFEGEFEKVFPNLATKLTRRMVGVKGELVDVFELIKIKFPMLIPKKFSDLIFGIDPIIAHETDSKKDKEIYDTLRRIKFWRMVKLAFLDCYMYGNGVVKAYNKSPNFVQNEVRTDLNPAVCPITHSSWVPIVNKSNQFDISGYLTGSVYNTSVDPNVQEHEIQIEQNMAGRYKVYIFECSKPDNLGVVTLNKLKYESSWIASPIESNRIKLFVNFGTSESGIYGISSYETYYELIGNLIDRMSQVSQILDEHSKPTMTGPKSLLDFNESTGEWFFKKSSFYGIDQMEKDVDVKYVTWEARLTECVEQINTITRLIYQMSETGSPFLDGDKDNVGFAESARALKIRHKSPLAAATAWVSDNKDEILQLVSDVCKIAGLKEISWNDLEMSWIPDLPEDELEKAQIFVTEQSAGMSFEDNLRRRYRMSAVGARQERLDRLNEDAEKLKQTKTIEAEFATTSSTSVNGDDSKGLDRRKSGLRGTAAIEQESADSQRRSNDQLGNPNKNA